LYTPQNQYSAFIHIFYHIIIYYLWQKPKITSFNMVKLASRNAILLAVIGLEADLSGGDSDTSAKRTNLSLGYLLK
jgi:hypothetical protein